MSEERLPNAEANVDGMDDLALADRSSKFVAFCPAVIAAVAFLLLWPTALSLLSEWQDEANTTTYTHGYLIAALCLWLLYRSGRRLVRLPTAPSALAWGLLIASVVVWLVAVRAGIQTVHQVLLPVLIWLAIWAALGLRAAWISTFGVAYLYFAIPIWGHVNEALQYGTVIVVEWLLRLTGVTAYVEDTFVHLGSGVIEIAHGCSGLHYFIVGLAVAALYGEVHRDPLKLRVRQLLLGATLALATNWLRVYIIIVAGYLTDMQHYLVTESHYMFGWYVFAGAMLIFFLIVRRMEPTDPIADSTRQSLSPSNRTSLLYGLTLACTGLAVGPFLGAVVGARANAPEESALLPADPGAWSGPLRALSSDWNPVFVGADVSSQGTYRHLDETVDLYVAAYESQAQKKELVGYTNSIIGNDAARVVSQAAITPQGAATELVVQTSAGQKYVLWYFYRIGSLQTNRGIVAQTWYGLSSLIGAPLSSVVALRAPCRESCENARTALQHFIDSVDLTFLEDQPS